MTSIRVASKAVLSPIFMRQICCMYASERSFMASAAFVQFLSNTSSSSETLSASKRLYVSMFMENSSVFNITTAQAGVSAIWDARRPNVMDFSCGCQPKCSSGTRSSRAAGFLRFGGEFRNDGFDDAHHSPPYAACRVLHGDYTFYENNTPDGRYFITDYSILRIQNAARAHCRDRRETPRRFYLYGLSP